MGLLFPRGEGFAVQRIRNRGARLQLHDAPGAGEGSLSNGFSATAGGRGMANRGGLAIRILAPAESLAGGVEQAPPLGLLSLDTGHHHLVSKGQ